MKRIVVVGGGGHAKVVISILKKADGFQIVGYVDREDKGSVLGAPYLGDDTILGSLIAANKADSAAIGLGQTKSSEKRREIWARVRQLGFEFPPIVSPDATVGEDVVIGEGSVVMDGVVISAGTTVGECCIVNTRASIDHDCEIGDFVHVAPGAILNGGVRVGDDSLLGAGCCVMHYKTVGKGCTVGLGANIIGDCPDGATYHGPRARQVE